MQVFWGQIAMVDAERRLLANALQDKRNQYFVLLSETYAPTIIFLIVTRTWSYGCNKAITGLK